VSRVFFTDRDLGKRFPAILQEAGILVEQHGDHFAPNARDDEWLPAVGAKGWLVLTHDKRIRYKINECDAVMTNGIGMFVIVGAAPYPELARSFVATFPRIEAFLDFVAPPFIAKVHRPTPGEMKRQSSARGRVEMWLTKEDWLRDRSRRG
jgi:hypothetical protein